MEPRYNEVPRDWQNLFVITKPRYNEVPRDWQNLFVITKPRYNEVPRDWQNLFVITKFRYIEELFCYWGKVNRSLYQGLRYIEVHYIEVLLHYINMQSRKEKQWRRKTKADSRPCHGFRRHFDK